ncbi:hypothetical protein [Nafulsella turpanensis]|uniref:hypothetical protein n=1 Tax=Nafulsella turpanensis TaxID=1265690 RepID=UPI000364BE1B|nr:hypothetical protein [Nafulsella turpanensis]
MGKDNQSFFRRIGGYASWNEKTPVTTNTLFNIGLAREQGRSRASLKEREKGWRGRKQDKQYWCHLILVCRKEIIYTEIFVL